MCTDFRVGTNEMWSYTNKYVASCLGCGRKRNSLIKGAFERDGAKTERIFTRKLVYPLRRAISWTTLYFKQSLSVGKNNFGCFLFR